METIYNYLNHLKLEGKSANTLSTYSFHLMRFHKWHTGKALDLEVIRPTNLMDFKEELMREGKKERTINAVISCLKGYYDYLILMEASKSNPVSDKLRIHIPTKKIERLSDEEINILFSYVSNLKENIKAAFYLMMGTGARVGEIASLTKSDFILQDSKIFINIQDAKWGSDRRIPIILKESAQVVYHYLESIDIAGLPAFRVSKRTLQTYATNFTKETGIPFYCHIIRHTFATIMLERGVAIEKIQYMLGHKTPNMTRHYTQGANIDVKDLAPTIWQGDDD